jgi:histone H3/H4
MKGISKAAIERIMHKANAERISAGALEEMAELLEEYGLKISWEAVGLARHAGRKTVKKEDVKLAAKRLRNPY